MYRVLIAISNTETEVGYIQGMNSVIGTLLLHLKEEDAYWMAVYLLRKRELSRVFTPPFVKTDIWNYQLEIIMQNILPDIYDHLVSAYIMVRMLTLSLLTDVQRNDDRLFFNILVPDSILSLSENQPCKQQFVETLEY